MDQRIARSRAQEGRGARLHGGRRNAGSGNHWQRKNDVRTDDNELFEYKRTDGKTISIAAADLESLRRNAHSEGRDPRFGIELGGRDYVLLSAGEYEVLKELAHAAQRAGLEPGSVSSPRPRTDAPAYGRRRKGTDPGG